MVGFAESHAGSPANIRFAHSAEDDGRNALAAGSTKESRQRHRNSGRLDEEESPAPREDFARLDVRSSAEDEDNIGLPARTHSHPTTASGGRLREAEAPDAANESLNLCDW
ncbi:hypothetical protein DLM45_03095 [Hyphomicrobium methylovorum]|nr:hypothetical protein [Hyphomicrobium methylovorum]